MMTYFLSLGSNINAKENLDLANEELNKILINTKSPSNPSALVLCIEEDLVLIKILLSSSCAKSRFSFALILLPSDKKYVIIYE